MNLSSVILLGVVAARPAPAVAGRLFFASDTLKVYRDSGTVWEDATPTPALGTLIMAGLAADRPDAGTAGRLYFATDTMKVYRDNGAAWIDVTPSPVLSASVLRDTAANKPAAATAGRLFFASDTLSIFRDGGAAWDDVTPAGGAGSFVPMGFLIGWNGGAATGADIAGHRPVDRGTPYRLTVLAQTAPLANQTIDIQLVRGGVPASILNAPLTLPAGQTGVVSTAFNTALFPFVAGDYLTISSVGAQPGSNIFVGLIAAPGIAGARGVYSAPLVGQVDVTIAHGLGTSDVIVQVFDGDGIAALPESCTIVNANSVRLTFGVAFSGKVVIIG